LEPDTVAQATTWNASAQRTALGHRSATTSAIQSAASALTGVICALRSAPSWSKNRRRVWALLTLQVTAVGFGVSLLVGWVLAITVDFSPWLRRALTPLLVASQTLPIIEPPC
jgi:ABC-type proline/glycine betaine transport system permease subunit